MKHEKNVFTKNENETKRKTKKSKDHCHCKVEHQKDAFALEQKANVCMYMFFLWPFAH